jgi:hypothetical protein
LLILQWVIPCGDRTGLKKHKKLFPGLSKLTKSGKMALKKEIKCLSGDNKEVGPTPELLCISNIRNMM